MCASRDSSSILRRALFLVPLVAAVALVRPAPAETVNVPCDALALPNVIAMVNGNGEEDHVWLAPSCVYELAATWVVGADLGDPVRVYGRGATLSGKGERTVLAVNAGATLHLTDITVTQGRSTEHGGGILNAGTLTLTDSTVSDSSAPAYGGGIRNLGTLRLARSTVSGNTAGVQGGGIDNAQGRLTLTESNVSGNSALYGGGIRNRGVAALFNSTVSDNRGFVGGGLFNNGTTARATLSNVTIARNTISGSGGGGGIRNEGALALDNSIIAASGAVGGDCFNSGTITPSGGNLVEDGSCAIAGALSGDPMLFAVAESFRFLPLIPGSPAIDAGSNSSCPGIDQTGSRRPRDGHRDGTSVCDLGAYESACGLLGIELFLVLPLARRLVRARSGRQPVL